MVVHRLNHSGTPASLMAYYRKTTKPKRYVRKTKALSKYQKKEVKAIVSRALPDNIQHLNSGTFNTTVLGTTFTVMSTDFFSTIPQGIVEGTRLGNKLRITKVVITGRIRTTNTTNGDTVTLAVLAQDNPASSLNTIAPGDYFQQNTAGFAPLSQKQDDTAIRCHWKKTYTIGPSGQWPAVSFTKVLRFKKPITVLYADADSTGAVINTLKNQMNLYGAAINASVTSVDTAYTVYYHGA